MTAVTMVRVTPGSVADQSSGLFGYVKLLLGIGLWIDGITARRSREGRISLAFPGRQDRAGRRHPYVHRIDPETRRAIEVEVLAKVNHQLEALGHA